MNLFNKISKIIKHPKSKDIQNYDVPYTTESKYKCLLRVIPNRLSSNGEIIIPKHFVNEGDNIEVTIKPRTGYSFSHITIKEMSMIGRLIDYSISIDGNVGKISFVMPKVDVVVSTSFIER